MKFRRKFGGESYKYQTSYRRKVNAELLKESLKDKGYKVRIVKSSDGYDVYARK